MATDLTPSAAVSHWMSDVDGPVAPQPALPGDTDADVVIVGAGYTGLWTAYYLAVADPTVRVVVLEARIAGFGASGRNGGWCSALFPVGPEAMARQHGRPAAIAMTRAMQATVDEVGRVSATEGIDCHYHKGGTVVLARSPAQRARALSEVDEMRALGFDETDLAWLDPAAARQRCNATSVLGGTFTPHCAAIQPARLVRGLAAAVRRRGVRLYEQSPVGSIAPGVVRTPHGAVRAPVIVLATEGYTAALPGQRRVMAPVYSLMVATEPLPPSFFAAAGLADRETFADHRHLIIYGQRTADDRLAFGGRGAPYHFGSAIRPSFDHDRRVHSALRAILADLFPALKEVRIEASWGGPLGIRRDWHPRVGFDPSAGLAWAGGYVGDGVGTANLAGRTLADLILGADSELVRLPWVGEPGRRWEPEPLRWLGISAMLRVMAVADLEERMTNRPSRLARWAHRLTGG